MTAVPTLREAIQKARSEKKAIGHFNISNLEALHGIYRAAKKLNVPVIIGVSEKERDFVGVGEVVALVREIRENEHFPIYLNADHTYSFERVKEAIDAGFDAAIFDGAQHSFEENVVATKRCVDYARQYTKETGRDVLIEAELGYIGVSSKLLDKVPEGVGTDPASLTSAEQALQFVQETGVDLFAPAVGNIHGMLKDIPNPRLNIERIAEITATIPQGLVLHGASGILTEDLENAVKAGIAIVHYNTELRVAYKDTLKDTLEKSGDEIAPYKYLEASVEAVEAVVESKLKTMNHMAQ